MRLVRAALRAYSIAAASALLVAMTTAYRIQEVQSVYLGVMAPAAAAGALVGIAAGDVRRALLGAIAMLAATLATLSTAYSLPAALGVIPSDLVNPFVFLAVKRAVSDVLMAVLPAILSSLIAGAVAER